MDPYLFVRSNTLGANNTGPAGVAYVLLTCLSALDTLEAGVNPRRAVLNRIKELCPASGGLLELRRIIGDASV